MLGKIAKTKRIHAKHIGAHRSSSRPMPGSDRLAAEVAATFAGGEHLDSVAGGEAAAGHAATCIRSSILIPVSASITAPTASDSAHISR